jgi:hypothetical protein
MLEIDLQVPRDRLLDFVEHFPDRVKNCHGKQVQHGLMKALEVSSFANYWFVLNSNNIWTVGFVFVN